MAEIRQTEDYEGQTKQQRGCPAPAHRRQPTRGALRIIGLASLRLSAYSAAEGLFVLGLRARPAIGGLGITWTGVTCAVMIVLARANTAPGSRVNIPCWSPRAGTPPSTSRWLEPWWVLRAVAGWRWADPMAGFVIVGYGIKEGGAARCHSHL